MLCRKTRDRCTRTPSEWVRAGDEFLMTPAGHRSKTVFHHQTVMLSLFPPHQGVRLWAEVTHPSFSCSLPAKDTDGWIWRQKGQATRLVVLMDCWPGVKPHSQETFAAWFSPRRSGSCVLYQPRCSFSLLFLQPFARCSSRSPSSCDLLPSRGALTEILIQSWEAMGPFEAQRRIKALVKVYLKMAVFTMTASSLLSSSDSHLSTQNWN